MSFAYFYSLQLSMPQRELVSVNSKKLFLGLKALLRYLQNDFHSCTVTIIYLFRFGHHKKEFVIRP